MDVPPDTFQAVLNWFFVAGVGMVSWYADSIRRRIDKLDQRADRIEHQQHQTALILAGDYMKRAEFLEISREIFTELRTISDKLDRKADK